MTEEERQAIRPLIELAREIVDPQGGFAADIAESYLTRLEAAIEKAEIALGEGD